MTSDIVTFEPKHIPEVAALFLRTFATGASPAFLKSQFEALFFQFPARDSDIVSRVFVGPDGAVGGFMGALPLAMQFAGRPVRAAVPTSLMVDRPEKNPLVGARLVRSFLSGPQDLSISEPTNLLAQRLWLKLGGETPVAESMEWLRVLKPVGFAVALAADQHRVMRATRGAAALADQLAVRALRLRFEPKERQPFRETEASPDTVRDFLADPASGYALHPAWPSETFRWMIDHAGANKSRGTLHGQLLTDRGGRPAAFFLYQGARGGIARVLHIQTRRDAAEAVLDSLLLHAQDIGCVGIKGRTQARLLDPLLRRNCVFFRRHASMVHSRDRELLGAIRAGEAVTAGLAGESWTRLVSDRAA